MLPVNQIKTGQSGFDLEGMSNEMNVFFRQEKTKDVRPVRIPPERRGHLAPLLLAIRSPVVWMIWSRDWYWPG